MALKFFPETILLLKEERLEGLLNQNKIDRMVMIIGAAVIHNDFKYLCKYC